MMMIGISTIKLSLVVIANDSQQKGCGFKPPMCRVFESQRNINCGKPLSWHCFIGMEGQT
jgi:hypothetical protein